MEKIKVDYSGTVKYLLHYKTLEGHVQIDLDTIIYCHGDGEGPYTLIVTDGNKKYSMCESIGSIENHLSEDYFCRCHKSWLVNIKKVLHYSSRGKLIVLNNHIRVPISRSRWPDTLNKLIIFQIQDKILRR